MVKARHMRIGRKFLLKFFYVMCRLQQVQGKHKLSGMQRLGISNTGITTRNMLSIIMSVMLSIIVCECV